jgi:hypothetical protein
MAHQEKGIRSGSGLQTFTTAGAMLCRSTEGAGINFSSFVGAFDADPFVFISALAH